MRFPQLPIGARFEYQGKVYVKVGPISASAEEGGQRMIPRHAMLRVLDGSAPAPAPRPARSLDEVTVLQAFETFHGTCLRAMTEAIQDVERLGIARRDLAQAREDFLAALVVGDQVSAQEDPT